MGLTRRRLRSGRSGRLSPPRYAEGPATRYVTHMFDAAKRTGSNIATKIKHPWTNGQVERMNRTIKEAPLRLYHYDRPDQFDAHCRINAYNYARLLKTLKGLTPTNTSANAGLPSQNVSTSIRSAKCRQIDSSKFRSRSDAPAVRRKTNETDTRRLQGASETRKTRRSAASVKEQQPQADREEAGSREGVLKQHFAALGTIFSGPAFSPPRTSARLPRERIMQE
jgi:hypothetical protein